MTAAIAGSGQPAVRSPTWSKIASENTPNMPVRISMPASSGSKRNAAPLRQPSTSKASEAEAQHEGRDYDGDRLDIHTEDAKQGALPGELIDQRRKAGEKEQYADEARPLRKAIAAATVASDGRSRVVMGRLLA